MTGETGFVNRVKSIIGSLAHVWNEFLGECMQEYYRRRLAFCGEDVLFYPGVSIVLPERVSIGSHSQLGERCHLRGGGRIVIGEWCQIANHVIIASTNHLIQGERYYGNIIHKDVTIGDNVWIASGALILPGVTIGDNSVIAAGAVVSRAVGTNVVVAGIPARVIARVPTGVGGDPASRGMK
jgi:galactoside O-acetyltransferase